MMKIQPIRGVYLCLLVFALAMMVDIYEVKVGDTVRWINAAGGRQYKPV